MITWRMYTPQPKKQHTPATLGALFRIGSTDRGLGDLGAIGPARARRNRDACWSWRVVSRLYRGFKALRDAGLIETLPRMIAVQSAGVDPIARGLGDGRRSPPLIQPGHSVADGILVAQPVRGRQILQALRDTNGFALRAENEAIAAAQKQMHGRGLMIETTSAVTAAALPQIIERIGGGAELVIAFTGSGLKDIGGAPSPTDAGA